MVELGQYHSHPSNWPDWGKIWENSLLFAWTFEFSPKMRTEGYEYETAMQCLCILYSNFLLFVFWNSTFFLSTHFPTFTLQTGLKIPFISNFWYLETSWTFWPDWKSSCFRLEKISPPTLMKRIPRTPTARDICLWWREVRPSWRLWT